MPKPSVDLPAQVRLALPSLLANLVTLPLVVGPIWLLSYLAEMSGARGHRCSMGMR